MGLSSHTNRRDCFANGISMQAARQHRVDVSSGHMCTILVLMYTCSQSYGYSNVGLLARPCTRINHAAEVLSRIRRIRVLSVYDDWLSLAGCGWRAAGCLAAGWRAHKQRCSTSYCNCASDCLCGCYCCHCRFCQRCQICAQRLQPPHHRLARAR